MKKIISGICIAALLFSCNSEEKKAETSATDSKTETGKAPVEILNDSSFVASSMAAFRAFENKDVEGYTANMDDNIMFRWSGGDSLAGKAAVKAYYTGRYNIIDNIKFSDHISLPVMANASPIATVPTGKWMLSWYRVDVKYKNGKAITFWAHNVQHYNDAGKMDIFNQYMDRHPIIEATKDLVK
ncbi:MAG: nuclear transport factor 2 family protein [Ferruginibacter sp.]